VSPSKIQFALYHSYRYAWHGKLGKNNHIQIGFCVVNKIIDLLTDPEGEASTGVFPA